MTTYHHKKPEVLARITRLNITDYVRRFLLKRKEVTGRLMKINYLKNAEWAREMLNNPKNTTFKSARDLDGNYGWNEQKVDFVRSNLKKNESYLFYFICNGCGDRVKYLYRYDEEESPLCRKCCNIKYKALPRPSRELSRLLKKNYLSVEAKYMIIKKAGITMQDMVDSGL